MVYRTTVAQNFHEQMISFIKGRINEQDLIDAAERLNEQTICETSINGHSFLMDAMHLSFDPTMKTSPKSAQELSDIIIKLVLDRAIDLGPSATKFLLLAHCVENFTTLHQLLISHSCQSLKKYLTLLRRCVDPSVQWITREEYQNLFFRYNQANLGPLQQILKTATPKHLNIYFQEIQKGINDGLIDAAPYKQLLIGSKSSKYSPLENVLNTQNHQFFEIYFAALKEAIAKKWITGIEYKEILMRAHQDNFTPLHHILNFADKKICDIYFAAVKQCLGNGWMKLTEYNRVITNP